jgi:AcrR family transcriptional regulator
MPRQIDHDARRRRIAEAVCTLIAEHGIEGVTLRDVAASAGVSMGAVQRAFPKDGMVGFALDHIATQAHERGASRIADTGTAQSARTLLGISIQEMALAGPGQRTQAVVWLTFTAQAAVREQLAGTMRDHHGKGLDLLIWLIQYGQRTGEIHADADADEEARFLSVLADGLTQHVALGLTTPADARRFIDRHTRHLWTQKA